MGPMDNERRWRRGATGWLWLLALVLALAIALFAVKGRGGSGSDRLRGNAVGTTAPASGPGATGPVNGPAETSGTTVRAGAPSASTLPSSSRSGGAGAGGSNLLLGGRPFPLPATGAGLRAQTGRPVRANGVKVLSVVGDEVFWVGSGGERRILVRLLTAGESAPKVRAGDKASFTGTLRANGAGAAGAYGVTRAEDSALLTRQGAHVEAKVSTLKLSK